MTANSLRLPPVSVEINGRPLTDPERSSLGEIRVSQKLSLPAQCEIMFFNQPPASVTEAAVPGAPLRVLLGQASPPLFAGEITALEYAYESAQGRQFRLRAYDRLHRLRKRQPVRAHVQVGLADLAREFASSLGLLAEVPSVNVIWRRLIQHGQTDLELLKQVAEACGLYFTLRGETLHLLTLEGIGDPIPLSLGDTLLEANFEVNGDSACRSVAAAGWDQQHAEAHAGRADHARVGRSVSMEVPPDRVGGSGERRLVHQALQDDTHGEALAQAELDSCVAREVGLRGLAEGDPRLRPGTRIDVQGVAPGIAGRYVLAEVTHVLDARQRFVSEISTYPALSPPRVPAAKVVLGTVTSIDDPDSCGRVQVALPACNGVETDWMGVVMVGAGARKGLTMLPDVGDTVLVLCAQDDPAQGIVLGGLYGAGGPPDGGIESRSVKRCTWLTPQGQKLRFDDGKGTVRLENADGSYFELGRDKVLIHAKADLDIEAPGKTITVRANVINFERG